MPLTPLTSYIGGNLYTPTCLFPLTLLRPVHWGRPLHVFGLTSEVSVVGASMSLTMGYHYEPSADLLVLVGVRHEHLWPNSHPSEDTLLAGSAAILCKGGLDVIRKEAWPFYRTIPGVCLYWELEEPNGPKGCVRRKITKIFFQVSCVIFDLPSSQARAVKWFRAMTSADLHKGQQAGAQRQQSGQPETARERVSG